MAAGLCGCPPPYQRSGHPPAHGKPVNHQEHDCPDQGHHEPGRVPGAVESDGSADVAAYHGTGDAEQAGNDDATRVLTRHEELGDCANDQPEHDPTEDSEHHASSLVRRPFLLKHLPCPATIHLPAPGNSCLSRTRVSVARAEPCGSAP